MFSSPQPLRGVLLVLSALILASASPAAELVIAENGACAYQIVVPDQSGDAVVDEWLTLAGRLVQAAFAKNGFELPITTESARTADKPAIYLGATKFARSHGVDVVPLDDWTYFFRTVGRDVIIAGRDRSDPVLRERGPVVPVALLGTMKGTCDFLREFAGVRFLFLNFDSSLYPTADGTKRAAKPGDPLALDTRSIAFLPMAKVALPAGFDRKKTPLLLANFDSSHETLFHIANNFFPQLGSLHGAEVTWYKVIPAAKYAKTNPEFFALMADGQRSSGQKFGFDQFVPLCPTNRGVQDLMFAEVEKRIAEGQKLIHISPMDAFRLDQCNCEDCVKLFGSRVRSFDDVRARGASGKLWQAYFRITERVRVKHPEVRFVVLNYQDTPISVDVIKRFPENVIADIQFASQRDFDRLAGVEFPAGVSGFEETFTGFGQAGPYVAERTPSHMAEVVQSIARNHVKWTHRDGAMGYVRGLQAPAYYVYGRLMDDPSADWHALQDEFCEAAFGEVAKPMGGFFDLLHTQMAIYSDFFGVFMPAWDRKYSRSRFHDSKWHVMSIYTPEFCAAANALLTRAESGAKEADVLARLHLVRIEWDYVRQLSRIFFLQNAWTMNPSQANLDPLLDAIDEWHSSIEKLAGGTGRSSMKPLSDWPRMKPFAGHFYSHAALVDEGYQQQWNNTCLNWDTQAIRAGVLSDKPRVKVASVSAEPVLDSKAWDAVPASTLRVHDGMPYSNTTTRVKLLRDAEHLYVRIDCLHPTKHPEDFHPRTPDNDIFSQEYVELGIVPPSAGDNVFRLAANPVEGGRYDATSKPAKNGRTEDKSWNGEWQFRFAVTGEKGPYSLPARVWTGWFRIPFRTLGANPPKLGETWSFNVARQRNGQSIIWCDGPSAKVTTTFGKLEF